MKFLSRISGKNRVYLDYASITPVDPKVMKVMQKTMTDFSANPSSIYAEGVVAKKKLDACRKDVADMLEAHADEIIFTSGGTESNNLAFKGIVEKASFDRPHVVLTSIEHPSILELVDWLKDNNCDVTIVPVQENGIVDPKEIKKALTQSTVLVSVMYANNEIGTIQPIAEIAKAIRLYRKEKGTAYPYFHTDASQAAAYCLLRIPVLGVDLLTLDGSKIYGPRGMGMLYMKRGIELNPQQLGGSQERELRAGTENLPAITGFTEAFRMIQSEKEKENARIAILRNKLFADIQKNHPHIIVNGDMYKRLPNNINICIPGADAEFLVLKLDVRGFAISSVTSCRNLFEDSSSYVVEALDRASEETKRPSCAKSSLRITLGRYTTARECTKFLHALNEVLLK